MKNKNNSDENNSDGDMKKVKTKIWIKTLLYSYKVFPRLISTVDKIVELQASNFSFSSNIFNSSSKLESQFEKVIDMSERKKSLVNIHIMMTKMLNDLPYESKKLVEYKFIDNMTSEDIATELEISERTVYRKIQKVLDEVYGYFFDNRWSLEFIEFQVKNEDWLFDKFNFYFREYLESLKQNQSKSSSES